MHRTIRIAAIVATMLPFAVPATRSNAAPPSLNSGDAGPIRYRVSNRDRRIAYRQRTRRVSHARAGTGHTPAVILDSNGNRAPTGELVKR